MFAEKERAQVTLQSIGDAVITTDREGRIDYMNPVAEQLSGWGKDEARGENLGTVLRLLDEVDPREAREPAGALPARGPTGAFCRAQRAAQPARPGDRDPGLGGADPGSGRQTSSAPWWCSATSPRSGA